MATSKNSEELRKRMGWNKTDKLQELQQRLDLMQCDGSADSMFELVNVVKDLITEIIQCDLSQENKKEVRHSSH